MSKTKLSIPKSLKQLEVQLDLMYLLLKLGLNPKKVKEDED